MEATASANFAAQALSFEPLDDNIKVQIPSVVAPRWIRGALLSSGGRHPDWRQHLHSCPTSWFAYRILEYERYVGLRCLFSKNKGKKGSLL